jgi:M6 family metalloprotease-like protein
VALLLVSFIWLAGGMAVADHNPAVPDGAIGLGKTVLVIPIVHQDPPCPDDPGPVACEWVVAGAPGPPRHTPAEWQTILNAEVNDYYLKATHGKTSFQFEVASDPTTGGGWFPAPHNINEYVASGSNVNGVSLGQDAMALADPYYDLAEWSRIVVMHNFQRRGGLKQTITYGGDKWPIVFVLEDSTDEALVSIMSHELGHTLGLPDLYGNYHTGNCAQWSDCGESNMGPWDLMARDPVFTHFSGYSKYENEWIPHVAPNVVNLQAWNGTPFSYNYTLRNLGEPGPNLLRVALLSGGSFYGYYVECRTRKAGLGDENLPEEGVLVTLVNRGTTSPTFCYRHASAWATSNNPANICDAALQPGETYFASNGVSFTNTGMDQDECSVEVSYNGDTISHDPAILEATQFDSPDIWVDSQVNGWGTYGPPTQTLDGDGAPVGPGDPMSPGQPHRIYFRVRNFGMAPAANVQVEVGVRQPLTLSTICGPAPGPVTIIGTKTIPLLPATWSNPPHVDYVEWLPSSSPAEIEVRLLSTPGEITLSNNNAVDSVTFYFPDCEDANNCPVNPYGPTLSVEHDCPDPVTARVVAKFIPPGWDVMVNPASALIQPGEGLDFEIDIQPGVVMEAANVDDPFVEIPIELSQTYGHRMTGEGGHTFDPIHGVRTLHFFLPEGAITCASVPGVVEVGATVNVSGAVTPLVPLSPVAVEYTSPGGVRRLQNVVTDARANFADLFTPDEEGDWQVRALWPAEESHRDATSPACPFVACRAPQQPVEIFEVTRLTREDHTVLHVDDPNPVGEGTGYVIYRSAVAALPQSDWSVLAVDVTDQDPTLPGVQWTDASGESSPTGIWYYQVAPYDGVCGAVGPW